MFQHVKALRDIAQGCYCVLSSSILKTAIQTCKFSIPGPRFVAHFKEQQLLPLSGVLVS